MSPKPLSKRLADLRAAIAAAQADLAALPGRPLPAAEAVARFNQWADSQAQAFDARRQAAALCQPRADTTFSDLLSLTARDIRPHLSAADAGPLVCWLMGDTIKKKMAAEIEGLDLSDALPAASRGAELRRLTLELERLEIAEEVLIRQLEAAGEHVRRRDEARIDIVLAPDAELAGDTAAAA